IQIEWLRNADDLHPTAIVLFNAGNFFSFHEPEVAEKLFLRAIAADPDESLYAYRLGQLYGDALARVPAREQGQADRVAARVEGIIKDHPDSAVLAGIRDSRVGKSAKPRHE